VARDYITAKDIFEFFRKCNIFMNLEELQQQMDDCEIDGFGRNDKVTIDVFFKFMTSFINPE